MMIAHGIARRAWLAVTLIRFTAGRLLNAIGVPGVVQPGTYESGVGPTSVCITVGPLFTVVSVNGIDVYIHRLTGAIDGVGLSVAGPARQHDGLDQPEQWRQPVEAPQPSFADNP